MDIEHNFTNNTIRNNMDIEYNFTNNFDKNQMNKYFSEIHNMIKSYTDYVNSITMFSSNFIGQTVTPPNIGITINNKLVELQNQFKEHGLSIYSYTSENQSTPNFQSTSPSFVGMAIMSDIISVIPNINRIIDNQFIVLDKLDDKLMPLEKMRGIRMFIFKVKSLFIPPKTATMLLSDDDKIMFMDNLQAYTDLDDWIFSYTLEKNLTSSILQYLKNKKCNENLIKDIMNRDIIPVLEKLGFENQIPKLKEEISKIYPAIQDVCQQIPKKNIVQTSQSDDQIQTSQFNGQVQISQFDDLDR